MQEANSQAQEEDKGATHQPTSALSRSASTRQSAEHKSFASITDQRASTSASNEATYTSIDKHEQRGYAETYKQATSNCKPRRLQTHTSASDTLCAVREPVLSTRRGVLEIDEAWSTRPLGRREDLKVYIDKGLQ